MANQIGNANNSRNIRTSLSSAQLGPNGEMPKRNGIKGQSLGRITRVDVTPQDKVELSESATTTVKAPQQIMAKTSHANTVLEEATKQIQNKLYALNEDLSAAHGFKNSENADYEASLSPQIATILGIGEQDTSPLKQEFLQFATDIINTVQSGDAEQLLNLFMDMYSSRFGATFTDGAWEYPFEFPESLDSNTEFTSVMHGIMSEVNLADPNRLTFLLANWFDSGLTSIEDGGDWHNWSAAGDFSDYTSDELSSAVGNILTNAGFTHNHVGTNEDGLGTLNGGGALNENMDRDAFDALARGVQDLFMGMVQAPSPVDSYIPTPEILPETLPYVPYTPTSPVDVYTPTPAPSAPQANHVTTPPPAQTNTAPVNQAGAASQVNGSRTADDVLAHLRDLMPGWVINGDWQDGFRNIQIDQSVLERMAEDPAEFDRVMNLIRGFEELVPQLEQWGENNPGQSLILSFMMDAEGNLAGIATIRTLLGVESVTSMDFSGNNSTWIETMQRTIDALA